MIDFNQAALKVILPLVLLSASVQAEGDYSFSSGNTKVTTIELFTSEGCSSCPPADAWLSKFKGDPRLWRRVIPMAFHVDYWDYIGWRDRFASPVYSARQRNHKNQGNIRSVYTPGFLVDGQEWRGWFRKGKLNLPETDVEQLRVRVNGSRINADYAGEVSEPLVLNVALLGFNLSNQIKNGENSGRRLNHDFVVLQHESAVSASGSWFLEMPSIENSLVKTKGLAAWVSGSNSLKPIQATGGWLTN